jgi:prepilin-type N-terminal cleavage/methylation domain-containing protein
MRVPNPLRGFTLIELLMVISIMVIMAAFILAGAKALGIGSKKAKTQTIVAAIRKGIELTNANKGGSVSPTEHPLACSAEPRFKFVRSPFPAPRPTPSAPASTGVALAGVEPENLVSGQSLLMLPSDLYADPVSPMLFAFMRENIGVIGAQQRRVTKYLLLPKPGPDPVPYVAANFLKVQSSEPLAPMNPPYIPMWFPNNLVPPADIYMKDPDFGLPSANKQAIDYLFGSSSVQGELAGLGALFTADPTLPETISKFKYPLNNATGDWTTGGPLPLVYTNHNGSDSNQDAHWKPGCIAINGSTIMAGAGAKWVHYRLPGLALYDAWENEILCTVTRNGDLRLWSPGADGVYVVEPGKNHKLDTVTPPPIAARAGDDQDGSHDNIFEGVK